MIFRLSQKLNTKIKAGVLDTVRLDDNAPCSALTRLRYRQADNPDFA
jgi:hypothetical protein